MQISNHANTRLDTEPPRHCQRLGFLRGRSHGNAKGGSSRTNGRTVICYPVPMLPPVTILGARICIPMPDLATVLIVVVALVCWERPSMRSSWRREPR